MFSLTLEPCKPSFCMAWNLVSHVTRWLTLYLRRVVLHPNTMHQCVCASVTSVRHLVGRLTTNTVCAHTRSSDSRCTNNRIESQQCGSLQRHLRAFDARRVPTVVRQDPLYRLYHSQTSIFSVNVNRFDSCVQACMYVCVYDFLGVIPTCMLGIPM